MQRGPTLGRIPLGTRAQHTHQVGVTGQGGQGAELRLESVPRPAVGGATVVEHGLHRVGSGVKMLAHCPRVMLPSLSVQTSLPCEGALTVVVAVVCGKLDTPKVAKL